MTRTERSAAIDSRSSPGARGFFLGHAGHRLVHQQQLRILGHHHADLEPLLLAVRQRSGLLAGLGGEADGLQRGRDAPSRVAHRRGRAAWRSTPLLGRRSDSSMFSHTVRFTNTDGVWNFRPTPRAAIWFSLSASEVGVAAEDHAAVLGLHPARDHVEQRRLAGAVGPDHHPQLAPVHEEVQAVERLEALVGHRDIFEVDDRVSSDCCIGAACTARSRGWPVRASGASRLLADGRRRRWARRPSAPTTPSGKNRTTPMKRPPRKSSQRSG